MHMKPSDILKKGETMTKICTTKNPSKILSEKGWIIFEDILNNSLLDSLKKDLDSAYEVCRATQLKNCVDINTDGTVHHVLALGNSFVDLLEMQLLHEHLIEYFEGNYIINSFGDVIHSQKEASYVCNIHRDVRSFTGNLIKQQLDYPRMLGYNQGENLSPHLQQILGYNPRIPTNLDEWYQPPEKSFYKPGQG